MDDRKRGVRNAIANYISKQERTANGPSRKNDKPEKAVEKDCLQWMRNQGWIVNIYESKATYNPGLGRYVSQNMKAGTVDCMGQMPSGLAVLVEFKAPGRRSTFAKESNYRQVKFLKDRIKAGAFGCVVDSSVQLYTIYEKWNQIYESKGQQRAIEYLLEALPKKSNKRKNTEELF